MSDIIKIEKVQREGARLLIMLAGESGSGKTHTALELAHGLSNYDMSKVGFLDTENGRGKLYADNFTTPYLYGELKPPFGPQRYIQAIEQFARAGVEVLIIDSGSHEWEGVGGCTDIAESGNPRLPNWNKAKAEHKKFMSAVLSSPMHIILCLRAREKAKPEKQIVDGREKTVYVDLGLQPITEKNVVYEATISLMMHSEGMRQDPLKVPGVLRDVMGRCNGYITAEDGHALRVWVDGGKEIDPKVTHYRGILTMAAESGMESLKKAWADIPDRIKKKIDPKGCPAEYKESAAAFDRLEAEKRTANVGNDPQAVNTLNQLASAAEAEQKAAHDQSQDSGQGSTAGDDSVM